MQSYTSQKKIWIGRWLLGVAVLHTLAASLFFGHVFLDVAQRGIFDTVGRDPMTAAAVWFLLFGAIMALLGMAITTLEQSENFTSARPLGLGILMLTLLGVALMPDSGFWLAFPPAIGLLRIKTKPIQ